MLPEASFDQVLLIHVYHEIERPSEFLWNLLPSLKRDGSVVVVEPDRTTLRHGTPPRLLLCEFASVGYEVVRFERLPDSERSEEHTSELQSLMRISYAVFCLKKKTEEQQNPLLYNSLHGTTIQEDH